MKKQLKWRLGKLPTPDEVLKLVDDKLITKEEARDILFNEQENIETDIESLETEIKFLRNLVEKLSQSKTNTIEIIRQIQPVYYQQKWYTNYDTWCSSTNALNQNTSETMNLLSSNFSDIQTF